MDRIFLCRRLMNASKAFPLATLAMTVTCFVASAAEPPPDPPKPGEPKIEHAVGVKDMLGSFKYILSTTGRVHVLTTHDTEHGLVEKTSKPRDGSYSSETLWNEGSNTNDLSWFFVRETAGKRVSVTIEGEYTTKTAGGSGTHGGGSNSKSIWTTMSVDLTLDADFDHDGKIATPNGADYSKVIAERKLKNDEKANPYGAFVVVGQKSDVILRKIMPTLPEEYKGSVFLMQCPVDAKLGDEAPALLKEPMIKVFSGNTEIKTATASVAPDNLWRLIQNADLPLKVEGLKPGQFMLVAAYGCKSKGISFFDYSRMTVIKFDLVKVSFGGGSYHKVKTDDGAHDYDAPHWQDNSSPLDGDADDAGDRQYPVSFASNTKIKVSAQWKMEPTALALKLKAKGQGPGNLSLPDVAATITDGPTSAEVTVTDIECANPLPDAVKFLNPMQIAWQLSPDDGASWFGAGASKNRMYVTLGDPATSPLYETVLDVACRNSAVQDKKAVADVVAGVWTEFTHPTTGVKRKAIDGFNKVDGLTMGYWYSNTPKQNLDSLLASTDGDGSCLAWSELLQATLNAHHITGADISEIKPDQAANPGASGFLIKHWHFVNHIRTGPNGINNTNAVGGDQPVMPKGQGLPDQPCVAHLPGNALHTAPIPDDRIANGLIVTGADGICNTTAAGGDIQIIPVGKGAPDMPCVGPAADGILHSVAGGDDKKVDGIFNGQPYPYLLGFDAVPGDRVSAQNNTHSPFGFLNHFVIKYNKLYYDPSYGVGPLTQKDHENGAIDGTYMDDNGNALVKKKDPAVRELKYNP